MRFVLTLLFSAILFGQNTKIYEINNGKQDSIIDELFAKSDFYYIYDQNLMKRSYDKGYYSSDNFDDVLTRLLGKDYTFSFNKSTNMYRIKRQIKNFRIFVLDIEKRPVVDCIVVIDKKERGKTDKYGVISLKEFIEDSLNLELYHVAYEKKQSLIYKNSDTTLVYLLKEKKYKAGLLIVDEEKKALGFYNEDGQIEIESNDLFNLSRSLGKNVLQGLNNISAGVNSGSFSQTNPSIRGQNTDYNMILFDGIPLYNLEHFNGFFSGLNPEIIKKSRINKSVYNVRYGGKLSGLVELESKNQLKDGFGAHLSLDLFSISGVMSTAIFKNFKLIFAGRKSSSEWLKNETYTNVTQYYKNNSVADDNLLDTLAVRKEPDFSFYDYQFKGNYHINHENQVSVTFFKSYDILKEDVSLSFFKFIDPNTKWNENSETEWVNKGMNLNYSYINKSGSEYKLSYIRSEYKSKYLQYYQDISDIKHQHENDLNEEWLRLDTEMMVLNNKLGFGFIYSSHMSTDYNSKYKVIMNDEKKQKKNVSSYLSYLAKSNTFSYDFGLRMNIINSTNYYSPRIMVNYRSEGNSELSFSYGRFYQSLYNLKNYNSYTGARNFWKFSGDKIAVSRSDKINFRYNFSRFGIESYYEKINSLPSVSEIHLSEKTENFSGSGYNYGVEFFYRYKSDKIGLSLIYSYNQAIRNFPHLVKSDFHSFYEAGHNFKLLSSYFYKDWTILTNWKLRSGSRYTKLNVKEYNSGILPSIHSLDLAVIRAFDFNFTKLELSVNLKNLYRQKNIIRREIRRELINTKVIEFYDNIELPSFLYSFTLSLTI